MAKLGGGVGGDRGICSCTADIVACGVAQPVVFADAAFALAGGRAPLVAEQFFQLRVRRRLQWMRIRNARHPGCEASHFLSPDKALIPSRV